MNTQIAHDRLAQADWLHSAPVQAVFTLLDGAEGRTRAVGGAVRDTLLGCLGNAVEVDFASELTPDQVMARCKAADVKVISTGLEFGTLTLLIGGESFEVTTLRQDVETDGRHARVAFGTDWRMDAERRDFTLNALYCGPDGHLFDPLDGLDDCLARRVRFIGNADARIDEDRLRVFRFFRFSASHGNQHFDPEGLAASRRAAGTLDALSAERVGQEMRRMLTLPFIAKTIEAMTDATIVPFESDIVSTLHRYEHLAPQVDLVDRLTLVCWGGDIKALQANWRLPNAICKRVVALRSAVRLLEHSDIYRVIAEHAAIVQSAAYIAGAQFDWSLSETNMLAERLMSIEPVAFPVSANDLMENGFEPGPDLGEALKKLKNRWIESGFTLDRKNLLENMQN